VVTPSEHNSQSKLSRRTFLRISSGAASAVLVSLMLRPKRASGGVLPPGYSSQGDFLAACISCGRCASVCDRGAIQIGADGWPHIKGINGWCDFCMLCADVCPTGALVRVDPESLQLGRAVIDREHCIPWNWSGCRLCYEACAVLQNAIWLDDGLRPHIETSRCNGCGACVYVCPQPADEGGSKKRARAVSLHPSS
jgi:ferredoxin-type protein NapG